MGVCRKLAALSLLLFAAYAFAQKPNFTWNWRSQEIIGRNDASIGNTSQVSEAERSALIDAIVLRLQKPMSDAGYDDDRIREIATTTRVRFVDMGESQPLLFATSLGLEGGCDALGNCPLWIFRRTDDGFLSLLTTIAASYTVQHDNGASELVLMHHVSPRQSGLMLYDFANDKLTAVGCYTALWPKPSDDPAQLADPKLEVCTNRQIQLEEGRPKPLPEARPLPEAPKAEQAQPEAQPAAPAKPDEAAPAPEAPKAEQSQPQAEPAAPAKPDEAAPAPAAPKAEQSQPEAEPAAPAKPDDAAPAPAAPKAEQSQPEAEPASPAKPDDAAPAPEAPKAEQSQPQAEPAAPTKPDEAAPAPEAPKAEQSQPDSQPPDTKQNESQPDSAPKPASPDQGDTAPQRQAPVAPEANPPQADAK